MIQISSGGNSFRPRRASWSCLAAAALTTQSTIVQTTPNAQLKRRVCILPILRRLKFKLACGPFPIVRVCAERRVVETRLLAKNATGRRRFQAPPARNLMLLPALFAAFGRRSFARRTACRLRRWSGWRSSRLRRRMCKRWRGSRRWRARWWWCRRRR